MQLLLTRIRKIEDSGKDSVPACTDPVGEEHRHQDLTTLLKLRV
jgi:hypothetical protein